MTNTWDEYKKLEMLPDSILSQSPNGPSFLNCLGRIWSLALHGRPERQSIIQQRKHLERCLKCSQFLPEQPDFWHQIWQLLTQPIERPRLQMSLPEPQITQICDRQGQVWWQVYDPLTGQTKYLDSETEVRIWLEEHPYP